MSELAATGLDAFHDFEARRKVHRLQDWNIIDALYKAYMSALVGIIAVAWLSGVVGDDLGSAARRSVAADGPAILGLLLVASAWVGMRSGHRGGPLTVTTATVRTVLLAPVDRGTVLRGPAIRQLRFAAFVGGAGGAAAGAFALRRFGGNPVAWLAVAAAYGCVLSLLLPATAMVQAGRRVPIGVTRAVLAGVGALTAADLVRGTLWSPLSRAGLFALSPLPRATGMGWSSPAVASGALVLATLAVAVPVFGLATIGGVSIEALERRSRLVTLLRFAATVRDLRAVITFRRLLGQESARGRPWVRLRRFRRFPVWRRDWQGVLRWPAVRFLRLAGLGVVIGLACVGAVGVAAELVVVAAAALYFAAAETAEGAAQEADHPTLSTSLPVSADALWLRHLAVPTVLMTAVTLVAVGTAACVVGFRALAGAMLAVPAAAVAVAMTSRSAFERPDPVESMRVMMSDPTGTAAVMQLIGPPIKAGSGAVILVILLRVIPDVTVLQAVRIAAVIEVVILILYVGYHASVRSRLPDSPFAPLTPPESRS